MVMPNSEHAAAQTAVALLFDAARGASGTAARTVRKGRRRLDWGEGSGGLAGRGDDVIDAGRAVEQGVVFFDETDPVEWSGVGDAGGRIGVRAGADASYGCRV